MCHRRPDHEPEPGGSRLGRPVRVHVLSSEVVAFVCPSVLPRTGVWVVFWAGVNSAAVHVLGRAFWGPGAPVLLGVCLGAQCLLRP